MDSCAGQNEVTQYAPPGAGVFFMPRMSETAPAIMAESKYFR
jgi:hypothetical protein